MRGDREAFEQAGATVALVCQGDEKRTAAFARELEWPFTWFADPGRELFQLFGLGKGTLAQVMGHDARRTAKEAARNGFHPRFKEAFYRHSSWLQMPGSFVIDRFGTLRFAHRAKHSGDYPPNEALLEAARQFAGN